MQEQPPQAGQNPATNTPTGATPAPEQQPNNDMIKPGMSKKKKLLILAVIVVALLALGAASWYFFIYKKDSAQPATTTDQATDTTTQVSKENQCKDSSATTVNVTWLNKREKLSNTKFLTISKYDELGVDKGTDTSKYNAYYKIGTTDSGQNVILFEKNIGFIEEVPGIAIEETPGNFIVLKQHSPYAGEEVLLSNAKIDDTKIIPDLCVFSVSYKDQTLSDPYIKDKDLEKYAGSGIDIFDGKEPNSKLVKLQEYDNGTLYQYNFKVASEYKMTEYYFKRKDSLWQKLESESPFGDFTNYEVPAITFKDGSKNKTGYSTRFRGCGASSAVEVATNLTSSDLTEVGTADSGSKVYEITSTNNPLLKLHFKEYQDDVKSDLIDKASLKNLSISEYKSKKPILVVQDVFDRYIVYISNDFNLGGGCGKPAVYLYPETTTNVNVSVSADVTKSVPLYGALGWQNVTASPSGNLTYNGTDFDYLYWEGYGHGLYPETSGLGRVVARKNVKQAIVNDLHTLGLNDKEVSDFMEFWGSRLPSTPYTRLTWLGTQDMDKLAPLNISPRPDTVIRVFLDFEGLNNKVSLQPQKLNSKARRGFTVVEWGGLLTDGSIPRL